MTKIPVQIISGCFKSSMLLLSFCCCLFCSIFSQQKLNNPSGAALIDADSANALSKKYWSKNLDSSVFFAQKALQLSQALNYKKGIAEAYRNIGVTNMIIGDKTIARQNLAKALELFAALPDKSGMAATYNNLGTLHFNLSEFAVSFKYLDSALMLFRATGNKEGEGSALNYIGISFQAQGNYQQAINYCLQGYEIRKQINDHQGVVYSLINVGNMYLDVGQPETALTFYQQSVAYAQDHGMVPFDYSLNQIGKTYLKLKQYDKAEASLVRKRNNGEKQISDHLTAGDLYNETGRLDNAINEFKTALADGNKNHKALSLTGLSKVSFKKGEFGQAMLYAKQAYAIADSVQNKLVLADVANVLAGLYKTGGDYKKAVHFFELAHSITDSVSGENYQRKLAFAESKNEIENEQAHVKLLSAEKELQTQKLKEEAFLKKLILIFFAFAIIISFVIIRNINGKRKKIESQKDQIELESAKVEKAYEKLKATQAQLIQSEKMASLGELTAGIAHEIQNPLNFVNNFSEVNTELIDELQNDLKAGNTENVLVILNDIKNNEQKINHHGKRADAIVKGMQQHSASNAGKKELVDVNSIAEEYLRLSYNGLRAKEKSFNADIRTDFDSSIEKINIIPHDIGRVLLNLYNNAFYAVAEKKKKQSAAGGYEPMVSVSTKKSGNGICISVSDNGNGIPGNIVDKIFQPFFTTKPTGQGTGLGLSLSYDIVKAYGGDIKVETKEGKGTTFIILLPV